jgi:hypothetical protein
MDRFEQVHFERVPLDVGDCEACNGTMYDYQEKDNSYDLQATMCQMCEAKIHQVCQKRCDHCGKPGCAVCMKEEDGLWICTACEEKREVSINAITIKMFQLGYTGGWRSKNGEQIIVEFAHADNPRVYVHVDKREAK